MSSTTRGLALSKGGPLGAAVPSRGTLALLRCGSGADTCVLSSGNQPEVSNQLQGIQTVTLGTKHVMAGGTSPARNYDSGAAPLPRLRSRDYSDVVDWDHRDAWYGTGTFRALPFRGDVRADAAPPASWRSVLI